MKFCFEFLLPPVVDNTIRGTRFPVYLFMLVAIVSAVRSSIHLLAPDGGAGSIAGMDLSVAGAPEIIFSFAMGQRTTDLRVHSTGGGVPLPLAGAVHVFTPVRRNSAAHAGGPHETGNFLAQAARRIRELRNAAAGRADAHPEFHDVAPDLAATRATPPFPMGTSENGTPSGD